VVVKNSWTDNVDISFEHLREDIADTAADMAELEESIKRDKERDRELYARIARIEEALFGIADSGMRGVSGPGVARKIYMAFGLSEEEIEGRTGR
jgi:hypothetical protein